MNSIPVGSTYSFQLIRGYQGAFGVYRKTYEDGSGRVSYLIARQPGSKASYSKPPASCLEEFNEEALAIDAFERWIQDSLSVQSPKRKRNGSDPA
jgi:hypothetical protein